MTALLTGETQSDCSDATQALLVQHYLTRGLRRPAARRRSEVRTPAHVDASMSHLDREPPASVRQAVDFINARAADPIGLTEIARAVQLSPRAVQAAFRRHLQTTPLGHLRAVRIARTHEDLRAARPGDGQTVSTIASAWGLNQLSRFARDYKLTYGVSPRQTLRSASE